MDKLFTLGLLLVVAVYYSDEAYIDSGFGMRPRVLEPDMEDHSNPQQFPGMRNNLLGNGLQRRQTGGARAAMGRTSPIQPVVSRPQPPSNYFPTYPYAYPRQQYYYYPYRYWLYGMMDEFFD